MTILLLVVHWHSSSSCMNLECEIKIVQKKFCSEVSKDYDTTIILRMDLNCEVIMIVQKKILFYTNNDKYISSAISSWH